ncbi:MULTISPECIES: YceD family protein [Corynebacterium]|uniref:YceD family protein n=1 Tax=Corynebacterium TaxID=1716 RepID=UPI000BAA69DE|nr:MULTISPECIES: YceD family protein [Corynebacterium]MCG7254415.1 YceD family protein [Corynebacterium hadale]MCG7256625.1 YceD family protein [Corynebacterium hadale]MCG7264169.1 YceD family protein [Corynebacterium hadale]PAT03526.1 DNA-binding protein [Corynebacterium sp. NML 150383]
MAKNPFIVDVADALHGDGMPVTVHLSGPSPSRVGPEMIALPEGQEVDVDATITPLGSGVLVDASLTAQFKGECVRCLKTLTPTKTLQISQVFEGDDGFIVGDAEAEEDQGSGDEIRRIEDETVDLEQAFVDEAGLTLPFNPVCEPECDGDTEVPDPDGVSGEENNLVDPRWAGLEKFL